jgi:hypothetical protein
MLADRVLLHYQDDRWVFSACHQLGAVDLASVLSGLYKGTIWFSKQVLNTLLLMLNWSEA